MAITHDRLPPEIERLPEPARSKAVEAANALIAEGSAEREAIEKAVGMALQYVDERARGDRSPIRDTTRS